jgi:phosphatidylinositol glycan class B
LHPAIFAALYYVVDKPMETLGFYPQFRAMILFTAPNVLQAVFAALGDYYTWQLTEKIYGTGSNYGTAAVSLFQYSSNLD